MDLFLQRELPSGFTYPPEFLHVVDLGLVRLEPWWILDGQELRSRQAGITQRYPHRPSVVFAARQDTDDVACWNPDRADGQVTIIHDWATSGAVRKTYPGFYPWFRAAVDDLIDFDLWPDKLPR